MARDRLASLGVLLGLTILTAGFGPATAQMHEPIYGAQLMTRQEIQDYHAKISSASSDVDRQHIRREHRREMQERAKRKGAVLHDRPIVPGVRTGGAMSADDKTGTGNGTGHGDSPDQRMGPGQGMDPGQGGGPGAGR